MDLERLKDDLRRYEGLRIKPYKDTVGKLTIGYGRNLTNVGISKQEAETLLHNDVTTAIATATRIYPGFDKLDEVRQEVLVNLAFNMGNGLAEFKGMLGALAAGNFNLAAARLLNSQYAKQVGKRAIDLAERLKTGQIKGGTLQG